MFTLWYTILSWKEYRDVIVGKLSKNKSANKTSADDGKSTPKSSKKEETSSRLPVLEPSKQSKSPSPQPPNKAQSNKPPSGPPPPLPKSAVLPQPSKPTSQGQKIITPASLKKPIRQPSPHPIRNEDYEEEYDEEDSDVDEDEDEEDEDDEDEDEDSLVDSVPAKPKVPWTEDSK